MSEVFQGIAALLAATYLVHYYRNWFANQNLKELNADPFRYCFGDHCSKFLRDIAIMMFGTYVFASNGLIILAFTFIAHFTLKWFVMIFIYGHVLRVHDKGKKVVVHNPAPQPPAKRVDFYV